MKRKVLAVALIIIGCGFLVYPIIGNIVNVMKQNAVQNEYNAMVQQLGIDKKEELKSNAEDFNKKLASGELSIISTDEDDLSSDYDDGSGYADALDVGSDAIAFIHIPKIDVNLPIYRGTSAITLQNGIGHLRNTSLPVGGESTHCVLTGHTGMPSSILFTDLNKLVEGDLFFIRYLDEVHAYCVDQIKIVEPTDSSELGIVEGKDYVTLLTCYPYGINSHRLLVRGERVAYNGQLSFDNKGKVKTVSEIKEETNDTALTTDDSSIFDEFLKNTAKVSVYGVNLPLTLVVIGVTIIIAAALGAVIVIIVQAMQKKRDNAQ